MRYKDIYVIWTVYFNSKLPRSSGRRLPLTESVINPTLEELINACKRLRLNIIEYKDASYPRVWWLKSGYVIVKKGDVNKRKLIRLIAKEIRRMRGGG